MISYLFIRLGGVLAKALPPQWTYFLFGLVGDLAWLVLRQKQAAAVANSTRVLGGVPEAKARRVARETFRNYARYIADFLRFPLLRPEEIARMVHFNDWEHLDEAVAQGKGAVFVSLHLGNWDLAAAVLAQRYPFNVVVDFVENERIDRYVQRTRAEKGVKVIPYSEAARASLRALRNGEVLGLLIDRPSPEGGVVVDFFGAPVAVPAGPAKLALKTGAPLVTGTLVRVGDDAYVGEIDRRLDFQPTGDAATDVQRLTQEIMRSLEKYAARYPDQLIMFRRFWLDEVSPRLQREPSPVV